MSDFCIIGAGINGLLLARELSRAGASVELLEKGKVGAEASWAGGGIVSPLYPWRYNKAVTELAHWAQVFYPRLAEELFEETGIDVQFNRCGLLMLDADDAQQALSWAQQYQRIMTQWSRTEIYRVAPQLRPGFHHGLWMEEIANVRNPRLLKALWQSLDATPNVTIRQQSEVAGLVRKGNRIAAVEMSSVRGANEAPVVSDTVIVTAGAWTANLLGKIRLKVPVTPVKGQMLLYKFSEPPVQSIVLHNGRYLIPRKDGHLLVGSTLEHVGFDKTITSAARESLYESAIRILPELESMTPVAQWAGLRPGSPEGIPLIGRIEAIENLYVSAGHYRNGLVLAPASTRLLGDLLLGRDPVLNPEVYNPSVRVPRSQLGP